MRWWKVYQALSSRGPVDHFALYFLAGSITSPRLFVYKDTEIDKELTNSAKVFCEDLVIFNIDMQQVWEHLVDNLFHMTSR